jgi:cupin fold WbuC family metalloprotein
VEYPLALPPPPGPITALSTALLEQVIEQSRGSPRGRIILPFHLGPQDHLHRMLNAMQPGSFVQPHRHLDPPKAECIVVLRGAVGYVTFTADGQVDRSLQVAAGGAEFGVDSQPGVYHTFFALQPDTVVFEVKPGPYDPASDKDFAPWAPPEGTPESAAYLAALVRRVQGD